MSKKFGSHALPEPRVLGIDPGLRGGWALVAHNGALLFCGAMPLTAHPAAPDKRIIDAPVLAQMISMAPPTVAIIEAVSSRPRQQGAFQFGVGVGVILGALSICGIPCRQVSPASWKATYGLRAVDYAADETTADGRRSQAFMKDEARRVASALFPDWADSFDQVKDDGVAEAVLIALHGLATPSLSNFAARIGS